MKIRIGFVSNSSSSSFIAIISDEDFEDALKELSSELSKKIIREITASKIVSRVPSKVLAGISCPGDIYPDRGDLSKELLKEMDDAEDDEDFFYETIREYRSLIRNHPNGFCHTENS